MEKVRDLHGLHYSLLGTVTAAVDLSDLLRAEVVLAVSAFDCFVHELTRLGMLECYSGSRAQTRAFMQFSVPIGAVPGFSSTELDSLIRAQHGFLSFQKPEKVADAIRLFHDVNLWEEVGKRTGTSKEDIKIRLRLIIDRRNKIAHEADLDPSFPNQRWPIDRPSVEYSIDTLQGIARAIYAVTA